MEARDTSPVATPKPNPETDVSSNHKNVAMSKIEEHQDAIHHGVTQGDQGIEAPPLQGVDQILKEICHRMRSLLEPLLPQHTRVHVAILTPCLRHGEKGPAL
jgi:hypothetical protein